MQEDEEEPDWAKVIHTAYQSAQGVVQWQGDLPEDHNQRDKDPPFDLREHTDLTDEEISDAVGFATRTELLEQIGSGMNYELTEKGFNVAHERELRKERHDIVESQANVGRVTAILTGVLAVNAAIQAVTTFLDVAPAVRFRLSIVYVVIVGAAAAAVKWYLGLKKAF